jgi:thiamine biosynthesis lipoprotein
MSHGKVKILKIILPVLAVTVLLFLLILDAREPRVQSRSYLDSFDTVSTLYDYSGDRDFSKTADTVGEMMREYHTLYDIYHSTDGGKGLYTLNRAGGDWVCVDERILELIEWSVDIYELTGGEVNIAMGSVLSIWHQYRTAGLDAPHAAKLPPIEALEAAAKHTDIGALVIDKEQGTVQITDPEMTLDVGAIAKGYAVEMAAQMLEARGITGYVINVGGNIRTVGTKGDGSKWLAGIENPDASSDEPYIAYVELSGESIVTSGSYQRYYLVNGQRYHHIIDRETLMPATGFLSVSVICKNSAQADALSTALFCMSPDEGLALVESLPDVEALWVSTDGTQRTSSGFSAYLRGDK